MNTTPRILPRLKRSRTNCWTHLAETAEITADTCEDTFLVSRTAGYKARKSAVRYGPSLLETHCHFYRAIRFLKKGVRLSNLFPEAFSQGGHQLGQAASSTERSGATKGCRDLGTPGGKSLYGHCTPPSAWCTLSASAHGGGKRKKENQPHYRN